MIANRGIASGVQFAYNHWREGTGFADLKVNGEKVTKDLHLKAALRVLQARLYQIEPDQRDIALLRDSTPGADHWDVRELVNYAILKAEM